MERETKMHALSATDSAISVHPMPATITTATQRKALEQRQATTRKALADRRKFLHRMRNTVHQYTGIDMRDQELVRLERENRDVKQALDALYTLKTLLDT